MLLGITNILVSLSPLILLPILSKSLGAEGYGVWTQFTITLTLIPAVACLGLPYTMVRFLSATRDLKKIQEAFYTLSAVVMLGCGGIALIILILAQPLADVLFKGNINVALILSVTIFISGLTLLFFDYFRTFKQMRTYSIFSFLQAYITVLIVSYLLMIGFNITGAVLGVLTTQIIIFMAMYILIFSQIKLKIPEFHNLREYLNFGLPTIPTNISFWILDITDRYLIGILLGLSFVGYYSAGYLLGSIVSILLSPFYTILLPILSEYHAENKMDEIRSLLNYSLKFFLTIAIPSVFILTILSRPILKLLSTPDIALYGYIITPIVALGGLFFGIYGIISQILVLERKTKVTGNIWIISIVLNLILDIGFGYYFGIIGIATTTFFVYLFAMILTIHYSFKYVKYIFYIRFLTKAVISSSIIFVILFILNPTGPLEIILALIFSFLLYILILWALGGIRKMEMMLFKDVFLDISGLLIKPIQKPLKRLKIKYVDQISISLEHDTLKTLKRFMKEQSTRRQLETAEKLRNISPHEAHHLIKEDEGVNELIIIDVRTSSEFAESHIKEAKNQDYEETTFHEEFKKMDKNRKYVIYSRSGRRGAHCLKVMKKMNFREVYNIQGGMLAWEKERLPLQSPLKS